MRLTISWRQSRFTSPGKGEVGERSEPGGGRDPHPTASRSTSPFQGEVKRVCGLAGAGFLRRCAPFLLAAALAGCASYSTEPSPEAQRAAWEARNLYPQTYRSEILAYMRNYFNDPRNVRDALVSEPELKPMGLGNRYIGRRRAAGQGAHRDLRWGQARRAAGREGPVRRRRLCGVSRARAPGAVVGSP